MTGGNGNGKTGSLIQVRGIDKTYQRGKRRLTCCADSIST